MSHAERMISTYEVRHVIEKGELNEMYSLQRGYGKKDSTLPD
ncbi:MAG: hypothetical protein ACC651_08150 [Candidatus Scalindua sp.]